jgi:hypothetical protein
LVSRPDEENISSYLQLIDKCLIHEVSTDWVSQTLPRCLEMLQSFCDVIVLVNNLFLSSGQSLIIAGEEPGYGYFKPKHSVYTTWGSEIHQTQRSEVRGRQRGYLTPEESLSDHLTWSPATWSRTSLSINIVLEYFAFWDREAGGGKEGEQSCTQIMLGCV